MPTVAASKDGMVWIPRSEGKGIQGRGEGMAENTSEPISWLEKH